VSSTEETIAALDRGEVRVAEKIDGEWRVNEEAKAAILDYFRLRTLEPVEVGPFEYLDKIPLKRDHAAAGVRVVPPATARYGSFLSRGVVLMPSYVNIGAWVGPNTMVDTWATVGSCAQIGADVHLAGGVGIGGVLEPVQARPVIVEDGSFIGSRCILTEGVLIGERAVLAQAERAGLPVQLLVNKADRPGADKLRQDIEVTLGIRQGNAFRHVPVHHGARTNPRGDGALLRADGWDHPVILTSAVKGEGIGDLTEALDRLFDRLAGTGELAERRRRRLLDRTRDVVDRATRRWLWEETGAERHVAGRLDDVVEGRISPYEVAAEVVEGLKQGART